MEEEGERDVFTLDTVRRGTRVRLCRLFLHFLFLCLRGPSTPCLDSRVLLQLKRYLECFSGHHKKVAKKGDLDLIGHRYH